MKISEHSFVSFFTKKNDNDFDPDRSEPQVAVKAIRQTITNRSLKTTAMRTIVF